MQFLGFVYAYFYVVTESSLYTLRSVVYSANEETIPCVKWSLTKSLKTNVQEVLIIGFFDRENFSVFSAYGRWLLTRSGRTQSETAT